MDVRLVLMYEHHLVADGMIIHLALIPEARFRGPSVYQNKAFPNIRAICGKTFPYESWDNINRKWEPGKIWCSSCSARRCWRVAISVVMI